MKFVHEKFDVDRLSKKKVIEKIRWTTFVDFDYHLGLRTKPEPVFENALIQKLLKKVKSFFQA